MKWYYGFWASWLAIATRSLLPSVTNKGAQIPKAFRTLSLAQPNVVSVYMREGCKRKSFCLFFCKRLKRQPDPQGTPMKGLKET